MMSGWKRSAAGPTTSSKAAAIAASPESPARARLPDTRCAAERRPHALAMRAARRAGSDRPRPRHPCGGASSGRATCCTAGGCGCAAARAWHGQVDGEAFAVRGARLAHGARERPAAGLVHADKHDRRVVEEEVVGALARARAVLSALCDGRACLTLTHGYEAPRSEPIFLSQIDTFR